MSELIDLSKKKYVVWDVECREDVDGQRNKFDQSQHLGIAVASTETGDGEIRDWIEDKDAWRLFSYLNQFEVIVSYNGLGFDNPLLGGSMLGEYHLASRGFVGNALKGRQVDLCLDFKEAIGARVRLQNVTIPTLNLAKEMDGGLAPQNWRKGKCLEVITYCRGDVDKTNKLFKLAASGQPLYVLDSQGNKKEFRCQPELR
jgi:hypothetical protein